MFQKYFLFSSQNEIDVQEKLLEKETMENDNTTVNYVLTCDLYLLPASNQTALSVDDNRPHVIHVCSKSYIYRHGLIRHITYECGKAQKFECFKCGHKFSRKDTLQKHIKTYRYKKDEYQL